MTGVGPRGTDEIGRVLADRWEWLEHQGVGSARVRQKSRHDLEDAGRAEDRIRNDYTGRYPIELLQNAHDACIDASHVGRVHFVLTSHALLVANEGVPFTADRIESLIRLGSSEKMQGRGRRRTIGYKGVGFTSVFEVADRPQVISAGASFQFDRARAKKKAASILREVVDIVPARYFPFEMSEADWEDDAREVRALLRDGAVTVIRLPFGRRADVDRIEQDLEDSLTPEVLLFMPALSAITVKTPTIAEAWERTSGRKIGLGRLVTLSGRRTTRAWLVAEERMRIGAEQVETLNDPLWAPVRSLNVAVALPWKPGRGVWEDAPPQQVHVYYPTEDALGRGVLIHGDFYVSSNRRHIETRKEGGAVSNLVARRAAKLAAALAASVAGKHGGHALLRCLAETGSAAGFGSDLGAMLDEELAEVALVRPARGVRPKRADSLYMLGTGGSTKFERDFVRLVEHASDIVRPGDDESDEVRSLLVSLGSEYIADSDLASRLAPRQAGLDYEDASRLIGEWLSKYVPIDWQYSSVVRTLRSNQIVKDVGGDWRTPAEVTIRRTGIPELPTQLRRTELLRPRSTYGRALIDELEIEELTPALALSDLLGSLQDETYGATEREATEALEFVGSLWNSHRSTVLEAKGELGIVPVPVRREGERRPAGWRGASNAYFGQRWTGDRLLEDLYGRFGEAEFLAETAPAKKEDRRDRMAFFEALGVGAAPRMISIDADRAQLGLRLGTEWLRSDEVRGALVCQEGHPQSGRRVRIAVLDRLDALLARPTRAAAEALCAALLSMEHPLGPKAQFYCTNRQHPGSKGARLGKAEGYQEHVLRTQQWIPVKRSKALELSLCAPEEAWTDVPPKMRWLTLPQSALKLKGLQKLGLPSAEHPSKEALSAALFVLHEEVPDLSDEPSVAKTAAWLQERLDSLLSRSPAKDAPAEPWFVATADGVVNWSARPMIPDVPGVLDIGGAEFLFPGRAWSGLRRAYALERASEVIKIRTRFDARARRAAVLPRDRKVQLLAILAAKGGDGSRVALRLARLVERHVHGLVVRLSLNGVTHSVGRDHFLDISRTKAGGISGATLYFGADVDEPLLYAELARDLAQYLDTEDDEATIELFFASPRPQLQRLSQEDLTLAGELFRKYARDGQDGPEADPSKEVDDVVEDEDASLARTVPQAGVSTMRRVTSGDGRSVEIGAGSSPDGGKPTLVSAGSVRFGPRQSVKGRPSIDERASSPGGSVTTKRGSTPQPLRAPNPDTEHEAVRVATRYAREVLGAEVSDVQSENLGWDLEFILPDRRLLVEVKGAEGEAPFIITRNERRAARERPAQYRLIYVSNLAGEAPELRVFENIGEYLTDEIMDPASWTVRHWQRIPHELISTTAGEPS